MPTLDVVKAMAFEVCAAENGSGRSAERMADRGQATILMALMLAMTVGLALVIVEVGRILHESALARTAADAAALAGAVEGEEAAARMAAANGGELEFYEEHIMDGGQAGTTIVTLGVRVGRAFQTARASALVEWVGRSSSSTTETEARASALVEWTAPD